jgi:hypothetical protein
MFEAIAESTQDIKPLHCVSARQGVDKGEFMAQYFQPILEGYFILFLYSSFSSACLMGTKRTKMLLVVRSPPLRKKLDEI